MSKLFRKYDADYVTHKNTTARIVVCRQDGRGRFPVFGTFSPNVGQTHNENPNRVRILYNVNT